MNMLHKTAFSGNQSSPRTCEGFVLRGKVEWRDWLIFAVLTALTYLLRQAFGGSVYFVDGPLLVGSIRLKWFVIQSPGYWLFAHLGGLFQDPADGLAFWNKLFSAVGTAVFYLLGRMLGASRFLAVLAALTYSCTYYIWFSGEIHSAYAAEILFPVLTLCCFLKLQQRRTVPWAIVAALSSGLAIALRPSDGIFLLPLWAWLLWRGRFPGKIVIAFFTVSLIAFLGWYLPTQRASHRVGFNSTGSQLMLCLRATSVFLVGITPHSLANIGRVYLPLLVAYWPLFPVLFRRRSRMAAQVVLLWALPGLLFFSFGYMADPTYLVFLSGAFVLAAVLQNRQRLALTSLATCLLWNICIFAGARPVESKSTGALLLNFTVVKYSAYGIQHRWTKTMGQTAEGTALF